MKGLFLAAATSLLVGAFLVPQPEKEWTLLIGGGIEGYLSPCGCTKPMQGGLRRKAQAYLHLTPSARTTRIELGPLSSGISRQDELKAETAAEILGAAGVHAISLAFEDIRLGPSMAANLSRMAKGAYVSSGVSLPSAVPSVQHGPFLIGSWDPRSTKMAEALEGGSVSQEEAISGLTQEAELKGLMPVLMLEAEKAIAIETAEKHPSLAVIVFRSKSNPPFEAERKGRTLLVTPGPDGKSIIKLSFKGAELVSQAPVSLGPEFKDEPEAQRIFLTYKQRLADEKLLDAMPRTEGKAYAGTQKCISCHTQAGKVWKASSHAFALKSLELDKSDRDPDCTGCHVVGLSSTKGFRSRATTPQLANVGCESCHGPGAAHAMTPKKVRLPSAKNACQKCHVPDHSPEFDQAAYWKKIAH